MYELEAKLVDHVFLPFLPSFNEKYENLRKFSLPSGDKENQIHMEGYQVSAQCMALVRDDCLVPTKDAPELGFVRESSEKQYVPDVIYKVSRTTKTFLLCFCRFSFILCKFFNCLDSITSFSEDFSCVRFNTNCH